MGLEVYIITAIVGFIAAFLSGSTAVGGAALMTAVLTICLGGEYAVPVLTIVMLISNLTRAGLGIHEIDWKSVKLFLITSLPLSLLGALGFTLLPKAVVNKVLGISVIIFVILRFLKFRQAVVGKKAILLFGFISGFLSGFVGSSGPISAALFFSLGLSPVGYVASEAVAVSVIHIGKIIVYGSLMNIEWKLWIFAIAIGCIMMLGTLLAKKFIGKFKVESFDMYVSVAMLLMGIYMVVS